MNDIKQIEYAIFGKPPGEDQETLLNTRAETYEEAERIIGILESEHGCTACRIYISDISQPFDFAKEAGVK